MYIMYLVNGNWGEWSQCSEPCSDGRGVRNRSCDDPKPSHGGDECVGFSSISCDLKKCEKGL